MNNYDSSEEIIKQAIRNLHSLGVKDDAKWIDGYIKNTFSGLVKELDYVKKNISKDHLVLEYGSAPFVFSTGLKLLGYTIIGTDIAPERFKNFDKLNLNVKKVNYDTETLPIESNSIDSIICNEVFEHMRGNLITTFEEAYRVLKPGGTIYISTPNLKSLFGIFMFLFMNKSCSCACDLYHEWNKINEIGHMGHVREYTAREISDFLTRIGFYIDRIEYSGQTLGGLKAIPFNILETFIPRYRPKMKIVARKL